MLTVTKETKVNGRVVTRELHGIEKALAAVAAYFALFWVFGAIFMLAAVFTSPFWLPILLVILALR